MASLRTGSRKDRTTYVQVLYRLNGRKTSTSFHDHASASKFRDLVNQVGPAKALEAIGADPGLQTITVSKWLKHHIPGRRATQSGGGPAGGGSR